MALPRVGSDSFYGKLLGNPVASLGGKARAKSLSPAKRSQIASKAANARWDKAMVDRASTASIEEIPEVEFDVNKLTLASFKKHIQFGA